ncbi:MAG: dihydrodipicolinate synthase family protein [Pirellulaceae bacterium]
MDPTARDILRRGVVIPACPLALTEKRRLDERHQRALCRYYIAAGAGGLAVGVHTTQFAIRDPAIGLFAPVLSLVAEELRRSSRPLVWIGGVCGDTKQAAAEAELIRDLGYHAALISLAALREASDDALIDHCRSVGAVIPLVGFYLQPAVGGRILPYRFWRRFLEIENVVAIKIAPFNRYQTLDVMRAVADSQRPDVALYTGNDDNIVSDLLTQYRFPNLREDASRDSADAEGEGQELRMVGGLLGHWAVWTSEAVELLKACQAVTAGASIPAALLRRGVEVTDCNAAVFDAANGFAGCIAGVHEVLRRQGLLAGTWFLDPDEKLSPGQAAEIDRVCRAYPHLVDDDFVAAHRDGWLREGPSYRNS